MALVWVECVTCFGKGRIFDPHYDMELICKVCNGKGGWFKNA